VNWTLDLAKIGLLGASGWLVAALLARGPASARHDLWLLVLLGAVLVPAAELLLPPLYVIVPATWEPPRPPLALWALGALVWAARLVPGLVALSRVARTGERWHTPAALAALSEAARLAGVTRPVRLLRSSAVPVPATWGVRRPVHVRRQDVMVEALLWLAGALYWFHPAVWLATARVRLERERACDEAVIATGARASDYCGHLVEIMRAATRGARGAVIGATMAAPCTLEQRVRALLASPDPAPVRSHSGMPLVLVGLLLIYALGAVAPCASGW